MMASRFDRKAMRFMAGVECMTLAVLLLVPLIFPVGLIGAIGTPIVAVMTVSAVVLAYFSFRLLYRHEMEDLERPYVTPGRDANAGLKGEDALDSKVDAAKTYYFSDGTGRHFRRGGGRL